MDLPLSFLHMVSQQLAEMTLGSSSTCCEAELPCPSYAGASETTSPCSPSKSSCCRASSEVPKVSQERGYAQEDRRATDTLFLPQPMKGGGHCTPFTA